MKRTLVSKLAFTTSLVTVSLANTAFAQDTAFTYQGRLEAAGVPANDAYDIRFRLFNDDLAGVQIGSTVCRDDVDIVNGLFSVELDFGQQFATPEDRYLAIEVRSVEGLDCNTGVDFLELLPRQRLTATPRASHALVAAAAFRLDAPDGSPTSAVFVDNAGRVGVGTTAPTAPLHVKGQGNTSPAGTPIARFTRGDADNFVAIFADIGGNYIVADDPTINQKDLRLQTRNNRNILLEPNGTGKVHVRHEEPTLILQDFGAAGNQSGYIGFWNSGLIETAWAGFGTPSDPDFSVVNARTNGDINLFPGPNGKVGIGPHFATAGDENLRIIRGTVNANGTLNRGAGFNVSGSGGDYLITFTTPFSASPSMTVTWEYSIGATPLFAAADNVGTATAGVVLQDSSGLVRNGPFHFIAVGPR